MRYMFYCDCGAYMESELVRDLSEAVELHQGSNQVHLAWEHEAQK